MFGRYKDIKNSEIYFDKLDEIMFEIINSGMVSISKLQRLYRYPYPKASDIINILLKYKYIKKSKRCYKPKISIQKFTKIVLERNR